MTDSELSQAKDSQKQGRREEIVAVLKTYSVGVQPDEYGHVPVPQDTILEAIAMLEDDGGPV